jgi:hypothetical protein
VLDWRSALFLSTRAKASAIEVKELTPFRKDWLFIDSSRTEEATWRGPLSGYEALGCRREGRIAAGQTAVLVAVIIATVSASGSRSSIGSSIVTHFVASRR